MQETGIEDHLNLRLAIVSDSVYERKRKRSRSLEAFDNPLKKIEQWCDGKIFELLQMREQMLKLDQKRQERVEDGKGLHLIHSLLISATSVNDNNLDLAIESLSDLYHGVSLTGDSVQRVAAYFADGLVARLLTRISPFYEIIMKSPTRDEEFLAFTALYRVSPYFQFAHFTANQAIIEAFEEEEERNNQALHVIDFDLSYGFQWPSLIQSLSEKATSDRQISLRITGYGKTLEELQETETRLVSFAKGFHNLVFEFQGYLRGSELVSQRRKKNETVAINLVFYLNTLNSFTKISHTLKIVHSINPSIVVLVEQEGNRNPKTFLSRFMESLHHFAAMFDSLDDCLPLDSTERLIIENNLLGTEIKRAMNYDEEETNCLKYEKLETWKARMECYGFGGIKLSSKSILQAKLLLKIKSHCRPIILDGENNGGFRISERDEGRTVSLQWQNRCLVTASAWKCV